MRMASMRKVAVFGCALVLAVFALSACSSGKDSGGGEGGGNVPEAASDQVVTFPRAYFPDAPTTEQATAQLEALGCTDVVDNGDGSFTASMSADAYNQLVSDLYDQVMDAVNTLGDKTTYPNIEEVTYDEGFSTMQVKLNTETPGIEDTFALAVVGVPASTYQQVAGLPVGCEVSLVLQSGTVQQTAVFPQ